MYKSEVQSWGGTDGVQPHHGSLHHRRFLQQGAEPGRDGRPERQAWKDSMNDNNVMIVTIARSASENGSYQPRHRRC